MPKKKKSHDQAKKLAWKCSRPGVWICWSEELKGQIVAIAHRLVDFGGWWVTAWEMSSITNASSFHASVWGNPRSMHFSKFEKGRTWAKRINAL